MNNPRIIGGIVTIVIVGFLAWYFSNIITYVLVAMVIAMIGNPIVRLLGAIRIGRLRLPHTLNCFLALLIILLVFATFISIFIPLVGSQAALISKIDINSLNDSIRESLIWLERTLSNTGILKKGQTIESIINENIESIVNLEGVSTYLTGIFSFAGSVFIGIFSILFITFFILKDEHLISKLALLVVHPNHHEKIINIFSESKRLLSRYFMGISLEVMSMIILLSLGLSLFGIQNAFLIGFFGGFMNIIPYLGPLIGASVGIILGVTNILSTGAFDQLWPVVFEIGGVFIAANLIDNILLQPLIYSSSVKAHPLEIFIVLLMGGSIAGILGMLLAIPTYTIIRVVAKQFLSQYRIVQKLTEHI